jgi:DNA-binding response OmpR family regulator
VRILIVDDQRDAGTLMTSLIAQAGHEACWTTNGSTAVRLAGELPPAVVLLDIHMPGISGYETARRLREWYGHQFPIFAVTADPVDIPLASESGFDGIFAKPFSATKLNALVSQLLQQSGDGQPETHPTDTPPRA